MSWLSRLVSILVLAAVVVAFALLIRSKMPATQVGESFTTCAAFRDGSKLATGSPVMIAGVRVGEVSRLTIDGDFARVEMKLRDDTILPIDSWVTKKAYSPFGDSYVEIIPGGPVETGAPTGQMLRPGQCLTRVAEGSSTDRVLRVIARAMPKFDLGLERIHEVATYGRKWAEGTLEDGVFTAQKWLDDERLEGPLRSADQAFERLEAATTSAAAAVREAKPGFDSAFTRVENGVTQARTKMAQVTVDLREGMKNAREGIDNIDPTIADMQELMARVDEGRGDDMAGTLGRLVNDPQPYDTINDAADSLREGVGAFTRFKSWLGLRIEFNIFSRLPRFFVTAEIRARTDKFYLVELEKGPLGDFPDDQISDAIGVPDYARYQVIRDRLRFTAQFGKTFGNWFQIRGGLKESTFGFGADVLAGKGRLKFSADLYGGYTRTPRLKVAGALAVFRSIYLIAGVDDALTTPGYLNIRQGGTEVPVQFDKIRFGRDYFLGATLHFDDADLATLIRVYGALLVGLL